MPVTCSSALACMARHALAPPFNSPPCLPAPLSFPPPSWATFLPRGVSPAGYMDLEDEETLDSYTSANDVR